ncbi:MAG: stage 0 sporulation family protein [Flavobacteriales bacterium]
MIRAGPIPTQTQKDLIMGCAGCSNNNGGGLPPGCNNNGACGIDGCDVKLHVFDWLANMELPDQMQANDHVEVRFKNGRKHFYRNVHNIPCQAGDMVVVEGAPGYDVGMVSLAGELVRPQMNKKGVIPGSDAIKRLYRKASGSDIERWKEVRDQEEDAMRKVRERVEGSGLSMKIMDLEYQGDGKKATVYYTAEQRVDFRRLVKGSARELQVRIEMKQIGEREAAGRIGGIGDCGRELCCSTWLTDFRSVTTSAARYQQLSLNPQKLAGQCGKLKCCLNYELDMYLEALKDFPDSKKKLETEKGRAFNMKTDIFKRKMWYLYEGEMAASPVALDIERVKEIIAMNQRGEKPQDLEAKGLGEKTDPVKGKDLLAQERADRFDTRNGSDKKKKGRDRKGKGGLRK